MSPLVMSPLRGLLCPSRKLVLPVIRVLPQYGTDKPVPQNGEDTAYLRSEAKMKRNDHRGGIGTFLLLTILVGPTGPSFAQETVPTSMDLKQLIEEAKRANPEIQAAKRRVEGAWARIPQARSLPDPMVSLGYQNEG